MAQQGIQIQKAEGEESLDSFGRAHSDKLQNMARSMISGLYMLLRSVKMYDPENDIFEKPLLQLVENINAIIRNDAKLELVAVKQSFYLNGMLVKVDPSALDNVRFLIEELKSRDVGGITLLKQIGVPELKNFVWIFAKEQNDSDLGDDGLKGRKLLNIKVAKWSKLKEKLNRDDTQDEAKIDRKKYALTVYGRAIFFVQKYMDALRKNEQPVNSSKAMRLIQDMIDISVDQRTHFLGMTSVRSESEYLVYHQVNVALMSIVFGAELGLTKAQLRDLGYTAMFHDAGMATVPDALSTKKGALTPEEKAIIAKAPLVSVRNILREKSLNRSTLMRVVATFEHKVDFGTAVRDAQGNIQMIIPKANLGAYAKIIAICDTFDALTSKRPFRDAYGPEVALMLMWTEMRNKFDPDLLKVFMRVMAIQPVKVLSKRQQNVSISGI
jgi:HD-GYP domain-containing protein (c-di-GMP phosphodiesterase class II)